MVTCSLWGVKLPWNKTSDDSEAAATGTADGSGTAGTGDDTGHLPKGYTPKKGRPTPRRNEVERAKGIRHDPVVPAETPAEARARRKALKESMTKQEWKQYKRKQKEERKRATDKARKAIDRGDERYLLDKDRGPAKAFVRDWVDSRRFYNSLMLPIAVVLLISLIIGGKFPAISAYLSIFGMISIILFAIEGIWLGRAAAKAALAAHPECTDSKLSLGFYAYSRASQPRKLRTPKPKVGLGGKPEK